MKKFNFVYVTKCLVNNKIYVGQHSTNNLNDGYLGSGVKLAKAIEKYGKKNFQLTVIEFCDIECINDIEEFYIKGLNSTNVNIGYNLIENNHPIQRLFGKDNPNFGRKRSEETKAKMRKARLGKRLSEQVKLKLSIFQLERHKHIDFTGVNNPMFGKKLSNETKRKLSENLSGDKNPMFGKTRHHSIETRIKMSKSHKKVI